MVFGTEMEKSGIPVLESRRGHSSGDLDWFPSRAEVSTEVIWNISRQTWLWLG